MPLILDGVELSSGSFTARNRATHDGSCEKVKESSSALLTLNSLQEMMESKRFLSKCERRLSLVGARNLFRFRIASLEARKMSEGSMRNKLRPAVGLDAIR